MSAFSICKQYILDDTGRQDMSDVIDRRIQRAVLKYHRIDFWKKDVIEQPYIWTISQNLQVLDTNLLPRFRAFAYMRKWDNNAFNPSTNANTGAVSGDIVEQSSLDRLMDGYGYDKQDIYIRTGTNIQINCSSAITQVLIGWFQDPDVSSPENITSWILTNYADLISAEVCARIFKDIGKDSEAASARDTVARELLILQTNNVLTGVH